ncbi:MULTISPECIES: hypothetical protein [Paenibacillus]|uniref:Prepilin type IV endopeptidase peptidase domain-containing protein n=2 Tax=Paenibacillus TaxID=44249 RepID=A0A7Y6BTE5_9BACL|nr:MULTISPECIES: hypothetical protein [Paenibacillus]KGP77786.1 hypothetical protein P364_0131470 [Paenibacillus sp. MAEPY2]KGP79567.1 hypothetical protein P363_0131045 [Paenibacillus sp. MAEPY1]MDN4603987.1 hypothetical protein [Paenibacillus vandeheii]NUU74683.1 hypothetical protein [Paenibacillus xylanilyticus]
MLVLTTLLIGIYNAFNMYCDIRWRITKNLWHLSFMVLFFGLIIWQYPTTIVWVLLCGFCAFLLIGLLMEQMGSTAPGDTKMMMTNGLGVSLFGLIGSEGFVGGHYRNTLLMFLGSLILILFLIDVYRFGRRYGIAKVLKTIFGHAFGFILRRVGFGHFAVEPEMSNASMRILPGAVMITAAVSLTVLVLYPY